MQAVRICDKRIWVEQASRPRRASGFARIRLRLAGICNTDLELLRGYYGFAGRPGHEFVGVVEEADSTFWVGKRVVGEINLACGSCKWCTAGLGRHCPRRTVLGILRHPGAFAEWLTLPEQNLLEVPASLSDEEAVFCEPVAAACEIQEQLGRLRGERVAVLGDGKLGLLIAQVLQVGGAQVHLFGRHEKKMAIAKAVGVRVGGAGEFDVTVDATGSAAGLATAVGMTRARGRVVMKSTVAEPVSLDMAPVIVKEISLVGSRCGRFGPALRLLAGGKIAVRPMIAERFPLREAERAFARAAERGCLKVLLSP
jgi:threonine dehydrogenase-like Zn-dependent dehydrogenase